MMNNIVFLGTPDFAVPTLRAMHEHGYNVIAVFTQPDRPSGRGKVIAPTPVKQYALEHNIPIYQFEKIKSPDGVAALKALQPSLIVTAAFGQILSQEILDIPTKGTINVHGSLLPYYRGPAPIQWCVINGETTTGITTMYTDIGIDTGDILLQKEVAIVPTETAGELFYRLADIGAEVLLDTLKALDNGTLKATKQDNSKATYFSMIKKPMADIDWSLPANKIASFIRGMNPWPVAFTHYNGTIMKIFCASVTDKYAEINAKCGEILIADSKNGMFIKTGAGVLELQTIQFAGSKAMTPCEYLRAKSIEVGAILCREDNK